MTRKKLQQKTSSADVQVQVNNTKDDFSLLTLTSQQRRGCKCVYTQDGLLNKERKKGKENNNNKSGSHMSGTHT
jgi:hypothetical protein